MSYEVTLSFQFIIIFCFRTVRYRLVQVIKCEVKSLVFKNKEYVNCKNGYKITPMSFCQSQFICKSCRTWRNSNCLKNKVHIFIDY